MYKILLAEDDSALERLRFCDSRCGFKRKRRSFDA